MAKIAFSRPQGRVEVFYPDEMSIQDLEDTLLVHLSVAKLAQNASHNPPETGVPKRALQERALDEIARLGQESDRDGKILE